MTEVERNKQFVRDFFAALSRGDARAMHDAYAEDGYCQTMGSTLISGKYNRTQVAQIGGQILGAFPNGIRFEIHHLTAEDDRVAVEAESFGEHISGRQYNNKYHFFVRLRDGKIVEFKEYMDTELVTEIICDGQRPAR